MHSQLLLVRIRDCSNFRLNSFWRPNRGECNCRDMRTARIWTKYDRANGMRRTTNACSKKDHEKKQFEYRQGRKTDGRVDRDWKCFVVALIMPRSVLCVICRMHILLALWKMTNVHMQWRKRAHNELRKIFWLWVMNTNLWSIIIIHVSSEYRMEMTANQNTSAGEMQAQRNMSTRCVCVCMCARVQLLRI